MAIRVVENLDGLLVAPHETAGFDKLLQREKTFL